MSAGSVLAQARAAGVEVLVYDGRLASRGPATPELRATIHAHRVELLALLTGKPPRRWPELPPLPDDDEHARWLRGEAPNASLTTHLPSPGTMTLERIESNGPNRVDAGLLRHG